ncbi:hypothetical protein V6N13_099297 [Hibiscus sabdariffa]|uniref:Uncharacterized protein n=1 Tax=Hibiscus sabdariffa TaxID=183260 RepID=A0ABR2PZ95_9ROSI
MGNSQLRECLDGEGSRNHLGITANSKDMWNSDEDQGIEEINGSCKVGDEGTMQGMDNGAICGVGNQHGQRKTCISNTQDGDNDYYEIEPPHLGAWQAKEV